MKKVISLKEYDRIIEGEGFGIVDGNHTLPNFAFKNFEIFINEYKKDIDGADVLDFFNVTFNRKYGRVITVKNYVGVISLPDGTMLEILPKISFNDDKQDITKEIFLSMVRSLTNVKYKVSALTSLDTSTTPLLELFIEMYLGEVRSLTKKGIKSFYELKEDNLFVYKGKIKPKEQMRYNLIHHERFYVEYDEYTTNRPENRLIKSTLVKLKGISSSISNIREIKNLLLSFELIDESVNYPNDFAKVEINRTNSEYERIMLWSKIFLENKSISTFSGSNKAYSILFPMEKVFEAYIASELKKVMHIHYPSYQVNTQHTGFFLFEDPRIFGLRPDIVINIDNKKQVVLDTKWKVLNNTAINYGISIGDMYQMYAYAKKYETKNVIVIYPCNEEMVEQKIFKSDDDIQVKIFFVDLTNINNSILELIKEIIAY